MNAEYEIERHAHGWLICAPPGQDGIPMGALGECLPMFDKNAVINSGIAHHFNTSGYNKTVVLAVAIPKESAAWEKEIADELKDFDPEDRWWRGTDVGKSSATIFAELCNDGHLGREADEFAQGATPRDASDFGRCWRLLAAMPGWRERLEEVAEKHRDTAWPEIVVRWGELELANAEEQSGILRECNS